MDVDRARVMAYRIARHGLHREVADPVSLGVFDLGVQDAGSRSWRVALAARLPADPAGTPELVTTWGLRGAPHVLRRADVADLAGRLYPLGDADAAARLGSTATRSLRAAGVPAGEAFAVGAAALREVVDRELSRGEASAAMTARLPAAYSYDCKACGARHVFGSLFQLVGVAAGVEVLADTRPSRLRPLPERHPLPTANTGAVPVAAAYLRLHGPAAVRRFAAFVDTSGREAARMWPEGLVPVRVEGEEAYLPEAEVEALRTAPVPDAVRLLPPLDPLLQGRDRDLLVPDGARRKQVWRVLGNPGAVLAGGEIVGTWRPRVVGTRLDLTVTAFLSLPRAVRTAIEAEAHRVALVRGLAGARVVITS